MNVIVIRDSMGDILGVAKSVSAAINYLVERGDLSKDTPFYAKKFERNVAVGVYFGSHWLETLRAWSVEQFNNEFAPFFELSEHSVAGV